MPLQAAGGSLSGSNAQAPDNVNLTTNSPADWIHWGYKPFEFDRKAGVTPQITTFTLVGGADPGPSNEIAAAYSWSDGVAPGGKVSNTRTGERVFEVGKGFQFTVPADTTLKTLRVYIGSRSSKGKFTATLSDASAPAYTLNIDQPAGSTGSREIALDFRAASSGQTLTVTYVVTARNRSGSFISLESAALQTGGGGGAATLSGAMSNVSNVNLTNKGPADWIHWGRISDAPANRKAGMTPLISDQSSVGEDVTPRPHAVDTRYSWSDGQPNRSISTRTGIRVFEINKGFRFTAPADTSNKTLKVYVGLNNAAQARFTATLSDGSAPVYRKTISQTSGRNSYVFTLNYQADSAGQQLTVTFVRANERGNFSWINLEAAVLQDGNPITNLPPTLTAIGNKTVTEGELFTVSLSASDADGPIPLTLSETNTLPGNPGILTDFGDGFGELNWTPAVGDASGGPYEVTVTATDGDLDASSETISLTVIPQDGGGGGGGGGGDGDGDGDSGSGDILAGAPAGGGSGGGCSFNDNPNGDVVLYLLSVLSLLYLLITRRSRACMR